MNIDIKKDGSRVGYGIFDRWCPALSEGQGTGFTLPLSSTLYFVLSFISPIARSVKLLL